MLSSRAHAVEQVEELEDDADVSAAETRQPVLPRPVDALAGDFDRAVVDGVETGDDVQQRRLAAAGRSGDRDELAVGDVEVDTAQRAYRRQLGGERASHAAHSYGATLVVGDCRRDSVTFDIAVDVDHLVHRVSPVVAMASSIGVARRNGEITPSRPLTRCSPSASQCQDGSASRTVAALAHGVAGRTGEVLQALGQVDRVTDHRVLEALVAPEQRGRYVAGR